MNWKDIIRSAFRHKRTYTGHLSTQFSHFIGQLLLNFCSDWPELWRRVQSALGKKTSHDQHWMLLWYDSRIVLWPFLFFLSVMFFSRKQLLLCEMNRLSLGREGNNCTPAPGFNYIWQERKPLLYTFLREVSAQFWIGPDSPYPFSAYGWIKFELVAEFFSSSRNRLTF